MEAFLLQIHCTQPSFCFFSRRNDSTPRKKISTSFLCAVIALSIIAFIVAGAVLLYQYRK